MTSLPEAKTLLNWEQPQPSVEDLRKEVGRPGISDDELLMRVLFPEEHVEATIAAGPIETGYPKGHKPAMALIQELTRQKDTAYIHVQKPGFSLSLKKNLS
jgi:oxaloacetate decarboxylase alpha subunit